MSYLAKTDPIEPLKVFTNARIALGYTGVTLPLTEVLNLQFAHAMAKDALKISLDCEYFEHKFKSNFQSFFRLESQAKDFDQYLKRPDFGRKLSEESVHILQKARNNSTDIALIVSDGLSAGAVNRYAGSVIEQYLWHQKNDYRISMALVKHGRVAISDQIGELLGARLSIILLGERPGLSNPQSLGIYVTYNPTMGNTDEQRNCISNIQENGLSAEQAVQLLLYLTKYSLQKQMSGVHLKMTLDLPLKELKHR